MDDGERASAATGGHPRGLASGLCTRYAGGRSLQNRRCGRDARNNYGPCMRPAPRAHRGAISVPQAAGAVRARVRGCYPYSGIIDAPRSSTEGSTATAVHGAGFLRPALLVLLPAPTAGSARPVKKPLPPSSARRAPLAARSRPHGCWCMQVDCILLRQPPSCRRWGASPVVGLTGCDGNFTGRSLPAPTHTQGRSTRKRHGPCTMCVKKTSAIYLLVVVRGERRAETKEWLSG